MNPVTNLTVDVATASADQEATDDRREHLRLQDELRLVVSCGGGTAVEAACLNMSIGGLCFACGQELEEGTEVTISATFAQDDFPTKLVAKIVYSREQQEGLWAYGAVFCALPPAELFNRLIQRRP